jgi:hypothetical protein
MDINPTFGGLKRKHGDISFPELFPLRRLEKHIAAKEDLLPFRQGE